jgi:hypothetical protein
MPLFKPLDLRMIKEEPNSNNQDVIIQVEHIIVLVYTLYNYMLTSVCEAMKQNFHKKRLHASLKLGKMCQLVLCLTFLSFFSFLCPLVMVMNKPSNVTTSLYMTTMLTVIAVVTTR